MLTTMTNITIGFAAVSAFNAAQGAVVPTTLGLIGTVAAGAVLANRAVDHTTSALDHDDATVAPGDSTVPEHDEAGEVVVLATAGTDHADDDQDAPTTTTDAVDGGTSDEGEGQLATVTPLRGGYHPHAATGVLPRRSVMEAMGWLPEVDCPDPTQRRVHLDRLITGELVRTVPASILALTDRTPVAATEAA